MGTEKILDSVTLTSTNDMSASTNQFLLVKGDTSNDRSFVVAGAGDKAIGILSEPMEDGYSAKIVTLGLYKVQAGATVTAYDPLTPDASGKAVTAANRADYIFGYALEDAVAGDIFSVYLMPNIPLLEFEDDYTSFSFHFADMSQIANGDLYNVTPGFAGEIVKVIWSQGPVAVTTPAKLSTLSTEIGGVAVTGGALSLTSAACTPAGKQVAASAVTATNAFTATDEITLKAASTTAFVEGCGSVTVICRRLEFTDDYVSWSFPFADMSQIADGDLYNLTPGFDGEIVKILWSQGPVAVSTGSKASTLSLEIGGSAVTGGAVALTSATCTPAGKQIAGSAITAANTFTSAQEITLLAASTTAFVEGCGMIVVIAKRS